MTGQRIGVLLSVFCLAASLPLSAAEPRAFVLGLPGLVPDEQADLGFNPASVNDVQGGRVFGAFNGGYNRTSNRSGTSFGEVTGIQHRLVFTPTLEWVSPFAGPRWDVQYAPSSDRSESRSNGFYTNTTSQRVGSGRVIYGRSLRQDLNMGLSLVTDDTTTRGQTNGPSSVTGRHSYLLTGGLISGGADRRLGTSVALGLVKADVTGGPTAFDDGARQTLSASVRFTPERRLTERTFWRGQAELGHQESSYDEALPGQDRKTRSENYQLGGGWLFQPQKGTLWVFNALLLGQVTWDKFGGAKETTALDSQHNFFATISLEQKLLSDRLAVMVSMNAIQAGYTRSHSGIVTGGASSNGFSVAGPSFFYYVGLGYQATERLGLELALNSQGVNAAKTKSNNGATISDTESASENFDFTLIYRL